METFDEQDVVVAACLGVVVEDITGVTSASGREDIHAVRVDTTSRVPACRFVNVLYSTRVDNNTINSPFDGSSLPLLQRTTGLCAFFSCRVFLAHHQSTVEVHLTLYSDESESIDTETELVVFVRRVRIAFPEC